MGHKKSLIVAPSTGFSGWAFCLLPEPRNKLQQERFPSSPKDE
jgi:hypothetical protein